MQTHHAIDYIEFNVTDMDEAKRFLAEAFGWEFNDYGPEYAGIKSGEGEAGGLRKMDEIVTGGPLVILYSEDLEATQAAVEAADHALRALASRGAPARRPRAAADGLDQLGAQQRQLVIDAARQLAHLGDQPRHQLGHVLERIAELSATFGLPIANVFHAGDGNLHPLIAFDANKDDELERAEKAVSYILMLCLEVGGTVTG